MPPEIVFALISMGCLGTSDFLYKWGQRWDLRGGPFMLLQNFAYMPTAFALTFIRSELAWSPGLWLGLLNGALAFTAFLFILLAMRRGEAISLIPIGRLGIPDDIAYAVLFLASAEAGYIAGETLSVNGGILMD